MGESTDNRQFSVLQKLKVLIISVFTPLGIFIVAQLVVALTISPFLPSLFDETADSSVVGNFAYIVLFELLAISLVWIFMKWRKHDLAWLGLGNRPKLKNMWLVLPAAGVYIVVSVVSFVVVDLLQTGVDLDQAQDVGFGSASSSTEVLLAFLALVIATPIAEEILMRGFMFRNLNRAFGFVIAALISAAIFGILHGQVNLFIDTFVLGLALAWLVNKTDSLWPAIGLHMLKNGIAFLYLFVF